MGEQRDEIRETGTPRRHAALSLHALSPLSALRTSLSPPHLRGARSAPERAWSHLALFQARSAFFLRNESLSPPAPKAHAMPSAIPAQSLPPKAQEPRTEDRIFPRTKPASQKEKTRRLRERLLAHTPLVSLSRSTHGSAGSSLSASRLTPRPRAQTDASSP